MHLQRAFQQGHPVGQPAQPGPAGGLRATGANNTTIAGRLFVTVRAVERHINAIFAKLGLAEEAEVHRRVGAVLMYLAAQS